MKQETITKLINILLEELQDETQEETEKNMPQNRIPIEFLTLKEVCQILRISRWTVAKLIESGELKAIKISGIYRFKREDIDLLIKNSEI